MKRKLIALLCALSLLTLSVPAVEVSGENPDETPVETAAELLDETLTETPTEVPDEDPAEVPEESPTEPFTEDSEETSAEDPTEAPDETPAEDPTEDPAEDPAEVPDETPTKITYVDVPEWEWYAQVVEEVTEKGLMTGLGGGYFGPNTGVNRAMVVTVLWRMEGCPQPESLESFADIDPQDLAFFWYAPQAAWAKSAGIANGYEDGTFHGLDLVTREQMASFLYQYAKYKGQPLAQGSLGLFDDAYQVSEWAVDAMKHVVGMGIIQGDAFGKLDPQGPTTRAALATMLHRMMIEAAG